MDSGKLNLYAGTEFTGSDEMAQFAAMKLEIGKQWVRPPARTLRGATRARCTAPIVTHARPMTGALAWLASSVAYPPTLPSPRRLTPSCEGTSSTGSRSTKPTS